MRGVEGQGPRVNMGQSPIPLYPMERIAGTRSRCGKCVAGGACYLGSWPSAGPKDACKPIRARVESACHSGWICHPIVRAPKGKGPGEHGAKPHTPFYSKDSGRRKPVRQTCGRRLLLFGKPAERGAKRSLQAHPDGGRKRVPFRLRLPSYRSGAKGQGPGADMGQSPIPLLS